MDNNSVSTPDELFWDDAKGGNIDSLYYLGGSGSPRQLYEMPEKLNFLIKAAELGHIEAQYDIGFLHESRLRDIESDIDDDFYTKIFSKEMSKEQHLKEMAKWYGKAANAGHSEALFRAAEAEFKLNNIDSALKLYTKAAMAGEEEAITGYRRGILYHIHKEKTKASWLEALSAVIEKRKDFEADTLESVAFELAQSNDAKYCKQAVELYEMVAEKGNSITNLSVLLGNIYSQSKDCLCEGAFEKDIEKAIYWYEKGDRRQELASLYFAEKEYSKSFDIYRHLAEEERDKCTRYAYWALGNCYYEGLGTVRNYYKAYKWFLIYKYYAPEYNINFAETKLSADMLGKAQHEAGELIEVMKIEEKKNEEELKNYIEELREKSALKSFLEMRYTEWREGIESVAKLLNQALPEEKFPTVYAWIDEENKGR